MCGFKSHPAHYWDLPTIGRVGCVGGVIGVSPHPEWIPVCLTRSVRIGGTEYEAAAQVDGVLRRLMADGAITEAAIVEACGCTRRTVRAWFLDDDEIRVPRRDTRQALASIVEQHAGFDERALLETGWDELLGNDLDLGDASTPAVEGTVAVLDIDERILIVDQAMLVLEGLYAHLPFKRALHAVDPVQRLRLIRHRLAEAEDDSQSIDDFHREMIDVFTTVKDLHTTYLVPEPLRSATVLLPFRVEQYFDTPDSDPTFVAGKVADDAARSTGFVDGVEISHWNGVPIQRAVELLAERQAAGNRPASEMRALDALTIRPLLSSMVPDESWVDITFKPDDATADAERHTVRFEWMRHDSDIALLPDHLDADLGFDAQTVAISRVREELYAGKKGGFFRTMTIGDDRYGDVRIFRFPTDTSPVAFVNQFIGLVKDLPEAGLIIDVRGNGGGSIRAAESLLQVLSADDAISPARFQFLATPLALHLSRNIKALGQWTDSLKQGAITGATHSRGFPITTESFLKRFVYRYPGPAVLIVDAACYSATDMFAAGFIDHEIGPVLSSSDNTGAGGANVLTHSAIRSLLKDTARAAGLVELPGGVDMRVALRRTLRVRARQGEILEDLGIMIENRHYMTRGDVFDGNVDLIDRALVLLDDEVAERARN